MISTTRSGASETKDNISLSTEFEASIKEGDMYDFSGATCERTSRERGKYKCTCCNSNQNPTPEECKFFEIKKNQTIVN